MSRRYKATGTWEQTQRLNVRNRDTLDQAVFTIEQADVEEITTGRVYRGDAFRVLRDGKPVRGKGGTVPFLGEMAWADAERKLSDVSWAHELGKAS